MKVILPTKSLVKINFLQIPRIVMPLVIEVQLDQNYIGEEMSLTRFIQGKRLDFTKFREVDHIKESGVSVLRPKSVITDSYGNPLEAQRSPVGSKGKYYFPDYYHCLAPGYTYTEDVVYSYQSTAGPYRNLVMTNNVTNGEVSYEHNSSNSFNSDGYFVVAKWWQSSPSQYDYETERTYGYYRNGEWVAGLVQTEQGHIHLYSFQYGPYVLQPACTEDDLKRVKIDFYEQFVYPSYVNKWKSLFLDPKGDPNDEQLYFACKDSLRQLDVVGINWYENLQLIQEGLKYIPNSIIKTADLVAQALKAGSDRDIKNVAKSASNLFLNKKYGVDNDLRDLKAIKGYRDLLTMLLKSVLTLHGSYDGVTATVLCSPFLSGWNIIEAIGIAPSASNLWAVVPFSFAVDWAFKTGHNLREIELSKMWAEDEYHIHSICYSYTHQWERSCQESILSQISFEPFKIKFKRYRRFVSQTAPDFVYEVPDYFSGMEDHIIEAGALILTKL